MLEKIVNFGIVYLSIGLVMGVIIFGIALYIIIRVIKEMREKEQINGYQPKETIPTEKVRSNPPKCGSAQQRK